MSVQPLLEACGASAPTEPQSPAGARLIGPHCQAPDACRASPKATHCKSCESKSRWADPERRKIKGERVSAGIRKTKRPPFKDELRTRRAVLYASAFGLKRASKILGIDPQKIALWRKRLEEIEGKTFPRVVNPTHTPKLSIETARVIRAQLADGEKQEYLALIHNVSPSTIGRINRGQLYPQLKIEEDLAAWSRLGGEGEAA